MKRGIISVLTFLILAPAILNAQNKRQYYKAGNDFLENGNYQDAIAQYTKAVDISPDYVKAYLERANAYELMGNLEKAAEDYKRATIFMPKETDVFYHTGRLYNDLGRYLEALEMLNIALELKSSNMAALQEKIIALTAMEQYVDALEVCNRALFLKENELNLYLTGIVQEELNNLEEAENHFSKSISKEKEFTDSYISLADLQVRLDKSAEALENINKALDLEPKNTEALFVRSKVYVKLLDYAKAVNDISTNILIEPDKEKWYFVRGTYYQHFTQHQNAINDFNKVLSMNDKYAEGYYKRAESYEEIANFNAAIKDYEKLIDLSEFDGKARQLLKSANERLFELNRETVSPVITVLLPKENEEGSIEIPREEVKFSLKGIVQDESELKSLFVNGNPVQFLETENGHEFFTTVVLEGMDEFNLQAEDVYGNVADKTYSICRTEINAPDIKLLAPYASDNGEIYLDSSDPTLYVEGKISDESFIKSILIDGVAASYKLDELNPSFTATLNISNKRSFIVNVVDIYGNESEKKFVFNR
ncbi:MAG: tetratricopeptide repeat protein, partial [Bacteroidales bacterium]